MFFNKYIKINVIKYNSFTLHQLRWIWVLYCEEVDPPTGSDLCVPSYPPGCPTQNNLNIWRSPSEQWMQRDDKRTR